MESLFSPLMYMTLEILKLSGTTVHNYMLTLKNVLIQLFGQPAILIYGSVRLNSSYILPFVNFICSLPL